MRSRYGISLKTVIHPTVFSAGSNVAFAHALKIALGAKGKLEILHVDREHSQAKWDSYPAVRTTLADWKILSAKASKSDVAKLRVDICKSACKGVKTAVGVLDHIHRRAADLVVMATQNRGGFDRWLHRSVAETVSNRTDASSLFVPYGSDGFVDVETGHVSLRRILIPVDASPDPQAAVKAVTELVSAICSDIVEITLLHIGDPATMPAATLPNSNNCRWILDTRRANVVDGICNYADEMDADLIAMTTNGHDGFLDALRGSTTERVLHQSDRPILAVHES